MPPFDHPMVIAGQGTLALELLQQDAHLDRVFVPVGGGGLAAGVAVLIKQLMPQIKVIAVEAGDSAMLCWAMYFFIPASASAPDGSATARTSSKRSFIAAQIASLSTVTISSRYSWHR